MDAAGAVLFQGDIPIGSSESRAGGSDFWGIVCASRTIACIEVDDRDDNDRYLDSNIGFDSLRVFPQPCPADITDDGEVNADDMLAYASLFKARDPEADFNLDGRVDKVDLTEFTAAFSTRE